jgi:hypothetical protein
MPAATPRAELDRVTRTGLVALALGRLAIGGGVWAVPQGALRALGFRHPGSEHEILARIAGTRDLALGGLQLAVLSSRDRSRLIAAAAAAVDAGDAAAFALARARGAERATAAIGIATAASAAVAGAWLAARLR